MFVKACINGFVPKHQVAITESTFIRCHSNSFEQLFPFLKCANRLGHRNCEKSCIKCSERAGRLASKRCNIYISTRRCMTRTFFK